MKFYKDKNNEVFAYSDEQLTHHVVVDKLKDLIAITKEEADAITNPPLTFGKLQASKLASLKIDYENANQLDIDYMSTIFQADKDSQNLIVSVLSAGSVPDGFFWLDVNNNQVIMTYEDLQGLSGAILARSQINFVKYQDLKAQVSIATTVDELDLIVW